MNLHTPIQACKGCLHFAAATLLVVILVMVGFTLEIGHFLIANNAPTKADAILVLGGEGGNFHRSRQAISLYQAGFAPIVVFSGGSLASTGLSCSSAEMSANAATQLGLPEQAILIADKAQSTYEEALNLRRLVQKHHWHTVIVVTDAFHTRRAGRTLSMYIPDARILMVAPPDPIYSPDSWWRNEFSLIAVLTEVIKLGFYWVKYGIVPV